VSTRTTIFIYGLSDLPIEQINNTTGEVLYLHHDQAGSTRLLTGSTGKVEGAYTYTPYGAVQEHTGTATTPLGYDAQYTNSETGLQYLRDRVYDPATAQFLTVDPAESISGAPYNYAGDNPINREDAVGLLWTPVAGGAAGADAVCGATVEIPGVDIGTCGAAGISTGIAAAGAAIGVVTAVAGNEGGDEGEAELKKKEAERENCGNPATPPGSKFKWEGNGPALSPVFGGSCGCRMPRPLSSPPPFLRSSGSSSARARSAPATLPGSLPGSRVLRKAEAHGQTRLRNFQVSACRPSAYI
jgi:RHS repeat-associated protein